MTDRDRAGTNVTGIDAYSPAEIAQRIEKAGLTKAALPLDKLIMLGLLAGLFIGFGGAFYTVAVTGSTLGFGPAKMLGGLAFSLGLVLVVIAGAELFTGNNLIVMAWADRNVTTAALLRNWAVTFLANSTAAAGLAYLIHLSGILNTGELKATAIAIAEAKLALPPLEAFIRGILCNTLVCLAVWLSFAAHTVSGKTLAIVFPITAFVTLGFEHSIANLYLIAVGILAGADGGFAGLAGNLVPVTIGNILGGAGGVAGVYWIVYGKRSDRA